MIVRESPRKGVSHPPQSWPPKSPHEALLSSPSGRKKYEQRRERNSVSPSPVKRRPLSRGLTYNEDQEMKDVDDADTEEEDEETLQLKLAQIEARLKLKKLQKAREARGQSSQDADNSRPGTSGGGGRAEGPVFARPRSALEVPMSPTRNYREPVEQTSPARVRLGIDKGIRAQDVSLKRAPIFRGQNTNTVVPGLRQADAAPKVKSFSQRLAESRSKDKEREEKQARIEKSRSTGFGLKIDPARGAASPRPSSSHSAATTSSAGDFLFGGGKARSHTVGEMRAPPTPRPVLRHAAHSSFSDTSRPVPSPRPSSNHSSHSGFPRSQSFDSATPGHILSQTAAKYAEISKRDNTTEAASFESFSSLHLKNRTMDHSRLTRVLEGKSVLTIPQLLKTVKAPEYDPPDMENDYVVIGVICSKSSPLTPKNAAKNQSVGNQDTDANQNGKFMIIKLTDLKWEVDLFLFDTGFSQFWKLPVGTLVAILNPDIMPPRQRDTGKFSLKLASSDDTVLEVGTARDLDFCHARKKDGKDCGQWIDGRKTESCDFHINLQLEKSKRGRMEINTMSGTGFGKPRGAGSFGMFGRGNNAKLEEKREGRFHDAFLHETMYIAPPAGGTARLLDSDEQGFERGASRAERHRKQLAEKEKERELARKLGEIGRGAGADYMRVKGAATPNLPARGDTLSQSEQAGKDKSAAALDTLQLLGRKAEDVSLAPVKRKRIATEKSAASSSRNLPMGWGGANRRGLLLSPAKTKPTTMVSRPGSPLKKKARLLVPDKGIREPGRDSLANMDIGLIAAMDMDDDDDDLEII